jgi:diaminohydroxyphosphoribosylaminopyrimidine deaminase/5-amino-6-(5-phosphoribosylamino)uracil reductase
MNQDFEFMKRAISLAQKGRGRVSPNPLVGCVIVQDGKIISEGWHQQYGGPHAEVNAVRAVTNKALLKGSTVYVNLEPCSHFGKTPPCADMLIESQVAKVVIANIDANPLVSGKGIGKLKDAGIAVVTGILEQEGRALNARFFTFIEKKRPYVILKWAETRDGFIARSNFQSKWISNEHSRQLVHRWRSEEDAVLVGTTTAQYDNPQLTVRDWPGRNPTRVVIDRYLRLNRFSNLFDGKTSTICYNTVRDEDAGLLKLVKISEQDFILKLLTDLHRQNIQSVMVEGGSKTIQLFVDLGLWDEARTFRSAQTFGTGVKAPCVDGLKMSEGNLSGDEVAFIQNRMPAEAPAQKN